MASVELSGVCKNFGAVEAVCDVSLSIKDREFVVFVGPSGCGKSTLLRMIAGLEEITSGELRIGGKRMNDVPAADRGIAMVFQSYALYPHMTVAENMGFGLKMSGVPKEEVRAKVAQAAAVLQIEELLDRKPRALSGGQRQRVAIGRAITRNPGVFLFDEPLSNLDAGLRAQMRIEIARLHAELDATMIYVTHDQVEAMTLADRIVVMNKGRVEQQGSPLDLYERPDNMFVASFLGQPRINFIQVRAESREGMAVLRLGAGDQVPLPPALSAAVEPGAALTLGIRPDAVGLSGEAADGSVAGSIELVEHLGSETLIHVRLPEMVGLTTVTMPGKGRVERGAACWLTFDPEQILLFDAGGTRLKPGAA
ncbi:ABC transporter ATP-binding protein [Chelativorans sp.]|uniref:ABC transporter ATP-binding protein n=1 Tax=Chelativorans sp. TaxID=2203393 RepID=UPI002810F3D8|nr:ABC transporter ATP-binding protein [Chelativorans sp.]